MRPTLRCAYLRVYQPLDALSEEDRERAERLLRHPPVRGRVAGELRPHALGLVAPEERKPIYERVVDGARYVCPSQLHLRTVLGMVSFERSLPQGVPASLFFTEEEVEAARRELERLSAEAPQLRPRLVQSAWHVPPRWFVCFSDSERRMEQGEDHLGIRYETTMLSAQERLGRALEILEGAGVPQTIVELVAELGEWLSPFDPRSLLELDYASVARLFSDEDLADDRSVLDVWNAIEALASGDGLKASLFYQRVTERWGLARAMAAHN